MNPDDPKPLRICLHSFPVPVDTRLALEQVVFDMAGTQPRLLREDRPWLEQPAIYTDCVLVVQSARAIAREWLEEVANKTRDS